VKKEEERLSAGFLQWQVSKLAGYGRVSRRRCFVRACVCVGKYFQSQPNVVFCET